MKIALIGVWGAIFLYLLNRLEIEKNIFNYVIAFFLLLIGVLLIDNLYNQKAKKAK